MAFKFLTGPDFNLAASYEGGTLPIAADVVCVPNTNANDIVSTGALNVDLGGVIVHKLFLGKFGSTGAPIPISCGKLEVYGGSEVYIDADKLGAAGGIDEVRVQMREAGHICHLRGQAGDAGDYVKMILNRGTITVSQSVEWGAGAIIEAGHVDNEADDLRLTVNAMGDVLPTFEQNGGRCTVLCTTTNLRILSGRCIKDFAKAVNVDVFSGGHLTYDHTAISGDATIMKVHGGGTVDLNGNVRNKTISEVNVYPAGVLIGLASLHTITARNFQVDSIIRGL